MPTAVPAADVLAAALEPLAAAASFDSTVTVDGTVVTTLKGRSVGTASQLEVTTDGKTVDYVRIPPEAWARQAGGKWVVVDESQAPDDPLAALAAPLTVTAAATSSAGSPGAGSGGASPAPGATMLAATYAAAALGLDGDPVPVTITIETGQVTFRYEATSGGHDVVSTTTFRAASATPAVAPPV